jgi:hypothetical protein
MKFLSLIKAPRTLGARPILEMLAYWAMKAYRDCPHEDFKRLFLQTIFVTQNGALFWNEFCDDSSCP